MKKFFLSLLTLLAVLALGHPSKVSAEATSTVIQAQVGFIASEPPPPVPSPPDPGEDEGGKSVGRLPKTGENASLLSPIGISMMLTSFLIYSYKKARK